MALNIYQKYCDRNQQVDNFHIFPGDPVGLFQGHRLMMLAVTLEIGSMAD
jgi:hypothetical protein